MYIIEVFDLKTHAWIPRYRTSNRDDARRRYYRLNNDGFNPRIRKEEPAQ